MLEQAANPRVLAGLKFLYKLRRYFQAHQSTTRQASGLRSEFYKQVWSDAAARAGMSLVDMGNGFLELRSANGVTRVNENTTDLDSFVSVLLAQDKPLVSRVLSDRGIRIPRQCAFTLNTVGSALKFLRDTGECVVKPATGGGGRGVTTDVTSTIGLLHAASQAAIFDTKLLIEEQIDGDVYRLLYLDGVLLDAVLRRPPSVVGDGKASVLELVHRENRRRLDRKGEVAQTLLQIDRDMHNALSQQRMSLSSVPLEGRVVRVKRVINDNCREDNISAMGQLCDSIVKDGADASLAIGVRLAGVDVITRDPSVPLAESGGVLLEVNATPSFHHHYHRDGPAFPVAERILPYLFSTGHSGYTSLAMTHVKGADV